MADRGDTHYSIQALNKWFLVSSIAILATTAWMLIDDWDRPWKQYQREFRAIETGKVAAREAELEREGALKSEEELRAKIVAAQATVDARGPALAKAEAELKLIKGDLWSAVEAAKEAKSAYNWERYVVEEERLKLGKPELDQERIDKVELEMNVRAGAQQKLEEQRATAMAAVAALTQEVSDATKAMLAGTRDLEQVRKRLSQLDPAMMTGPEKLADIVRDAPGLDFVKPNLKVAKVVLDNLTFELNFTKKKRIDMCHTCHLGIDRAGFESEQQPFATHPRLDLFLTSKSPHPLKDVGCTICHRGSGEALDFVRADHRPADAEQGAEWHEQRGWHKEHHWDYPMLASDFVEAACVQCHKTSMDLIADDAPRVTAGYRLVEQYGCYSCHKIDWFPTKRRTGPSLLNLQAKLSPEFIASWITNPDAFRPTTWMPQFFHLENFSPDETISISKYGTGRAIKGDEWSNASVAAITTYLMERAPTQPVPPMPLAGDAHRGRETMRLSGCLACHNMAPYGDEPAAAADMALERRGTNEHGPNLRGVATKLGADWLYAWIKNPQAYWPDTRMPNLRLSDQDAADITAYVMDDPDHIFHDVPKGWDVTRIAAQSLSMDAAKMREVLAEQARWFYAQDGRTAVEARLEGQDAKVRWDDLHTLQVAVGGKLVANYGCFSCHEISGLQDTMPIGTELSNWGSKPVDKLLFNFGAHEFGLDPQYREGWLMQKLKAPRSYDAKKVLNPTERLRMPYFGFTEDQVQSIATFVVGLVDDEVQRAKMVPTPDKLAVDAGMRSVRQKNCIACHMIDPGTVTFSDDAGTHTVVAELVNFEEQKVPSAHDLASVKKDAAKYEAEEVAFRVLRSEPEVQLGVGDKLFVPLDKLVALTAPRGGDFIRVVSDYYYNGIEIHDPSKSGDEAFSYASGGTDPDKVEVDNVDGKLREYSNEPYDKVRWTFAPPVLWDEGAKLQRPWFFAFLGDVVPLRQQLRVRMPSFRFNPGEAESIADYFAFKSSKEWPANFARQMRLATKKTAVDMAAACKLDAATLLDIENGRQVAIKANFPKVVTYAEASGFKTRAPVNPAYEASTLRSQSYLTQRAAQLPGHLSLGETVAVKAVNCFQCHYRMGQPPPADPIAWAPDLNLARERLREDWVRDWVNNPALLYPGTSMPSNFASTPPQYQEHFPNSSNDAQIRVVLDWLYNFDRIYMSSKN